MRQYREKVKEKQEAQDRPKGAPYLETRKKIKRNEGQGRGE